MKMSPVLIKTEKDKLNNMKYKKVSALFIIPESADIKTVIGSLWDMYEVDRISEEVEDEPVMFIIEETKREEVKSPEETVDVGGLQSEGLLEKLIG